MRSGLMNKFTAFWKRAFLAHADPAPLGLFRIAFGLFLLIFFFALGPNWESYYGAGGMRPEPAAANGLSLIVALEPWIPARAWWWAAWTAAVFFTLGLRTRLATVALFIIQSSMNHANPMVVNGEDLVVRMLLFYGIFAPLGAAFALDSKYGGSRYGTKRTGGPMPVWALRLMQINIAGVYLFSLPVKLASDASWLNGEALYWVMMTSTWNRWPVQSWFYEGSLSLVLTAATVLAEGLFPILVLFRRTRLPMVAVMACFHLGLALALKHVSFFSISMACSFLLFLSAAQARRVVILTRGIVKIS